MTVRRRIALRFRLAMKAAGLILADKSLLVFPCVSIAFASMTLGFFYFTVGPDKMQLMLNTLRNEQGVQTINLGYYGALAVALYLIACLATAMNFALAACTRIAAGEGGSRLWGAFAVAVRRMPAIVLWSLISITLGTIWTLLDQERRSSAFLRRRFGNTWSNMTMLAVPVAVFEQRNILAAFWRSRTLMRDTWGKNLNARFGSFWFVAVMNVPLLIKYLSLRYTGVGLTLPFVEIGLVYFACTIILAQTAKAVLRVALYRFAAEGVITRGFDRELLEEAFESYVLVKRTIERPREAGPFPKKPVTPLLEEDAPELAASATITLPQSE